MKDLIITVGVMLLLLTFPLQYALEQQNHYKASQVQKIVHTAKEKAKQEGYFTTAIKEEIRTELSHTLKIPKGQISMTVTETPKYRINEFDERELLQYRIEVPIQKVIATPGFFGISDQNNKAVYIVEGSTSSELVKP